LKRVLGWIVKALLGLLTTSLLGVVGVVLALERKTYEPPAVAVKASTDPEVIARGRYLAQGPAHCAACHADQAAYRNAGPDDEVPLSGGNEFQLPLGTIRASNLTSDEETGIGAVDDASLARALRHGVDRSGKVLFPIMSFAELSDEDLAAIISYLRTQAPVKHAVNTREYNALGLMVSAMTFRPTTPASTPPVSVEQGATAENGAYLVDRVASCTGCHTERDRASGQYVGPRLAGGFKFESHVRQGVVFVSPNLTPDEKTGRIFHWTEDTFVARMKAGAGPEGSPMPWKAFARMSEDDLRAIYRHLKTATPVERDNGPSIIEPPAAQASR
jgi:mono/diheme cytochrome c family protein